MAGKKRIVEVEALVNLKYDKEVKKIGEKFKVKTKDIKELTERGIVKLLENIEDDLGEPNDEGDTNNENDE
ncbi:MAG: hypothetical protein N4A57_02725 [Anaeromicrobium sp.]|uniref:DUF7210 family protein n=1 Tax=Anaeromicrobium sp. TaxID=1929132 RepID=UPI0025D7C046|nr:hypothetical protein [Anaeromicrobium sp.]MCT4593175.1 hypothetical protein [Anaeromicrobium sp.]